tara:strand:- start:9287 stop:10399 length:1113 start_codon:yes stop_codon:yes gene_type:complete
MSNSKPYYIGLMSGTSMDGIDAALVEFDQETLRVIAYHEEELPSHLLKQLHRLCLPGENEINMLGKCHRQLGQLFAQATLNLLKHAHVDSKQVQAIGSHGQTIRHMPHGNLGFSLQVGDPHTIASETGIDVIADFRGKDIALGGEGAPLVPAFHQALFAQKNKIRLLINIGGIANITYLNGTKEVIGFDSGPGNTLLDAWSREVHNKAFDEQGAFAAQGQPCTALLDHMCQHTFFKQDIPKSTGRELFNTAWLKQQLSHFQHLSDQDVQATLLAFTSRTIAEAVLKITPKGDVFICGGGALNPVLMNTLQQDLPHFQVQPTDALGLPAQQVEAVAFAWLAKQFKEKNPTSLPQVTGSRREAILGAYYPAD